MSSPLVYPSVKKRKDEKRGGVRIGWGFGRSVVGKN